MESETPTLNILNFGFYLAYSHLFQTIEFKKFLLLQVFLQSGIVLLSCIVAVSKVTAFPSPVNTCSEKSYITLFSEHVQFKNTSQLIKATSEISKNCLDD